MNRQRYPLHIVLFLVTVFTTLMAGAAHVSGKSWFEGDFPDRLDWGDLVLGIPYSVAFLAFLTAHEFGHYFTAVYHRVRCTLPYYIPLFIPFLPMNIGSLGAVIRIRQVPDSRRKFFDIGVAGPLAGFVVSVAMLVYGFATLPDKEQYIYQIHPFYEQAGHVMTPEEVMELYPGAMVIEVGSNLLYEGLAHLIPSDRSQVPPPSEMMHYPFLFVGFLTLFFTAMNLLPIGQLDGGHVIYGLFGPRVAGVVSRAAVIGLLMIGGTGVAKVDTYCAPLYGDSFGFFLGYQIVTLAIYLLFLVFIIGRIFKAWPLLWKVGAAAAMFSLQFAINLMIPGIQPYGLWLLYALLAVRMIGLDHPTTLNEAPLTTGRKVMAWLAIVIFILCFTPFPLKMVEMACPSMN